MKSFVLFMAFAFFGVAGNCKTYYVSPNGSDTNDGTSTLTPWRSIFKINHSTFVPGDKIMFQRGGTWRETLIPPSSGSTSLPIIFSAYGTGPKPTINGADIYVGEWTPASTPNLWQLKSPLPNDVTPTVMVDGEIYSRVMSVDSIVKKSFYIDKKNTSDEIYVYSYHNPNNLTVEISTRHYAIYLGRKSNILIENFNLINCLYSGLRLDGQGLFDGKPNTRFRGNAIVDGVTASNSVMYGIVTGNGYTHSIIKNSRADHNGNGFYSDGNGDFTLFQSDTAFNNHSNTDPFTDGNGFGVYKSSFNTIEGCISNSNKTGNGIEVDLNNTDSAIVIRYNQTHGNGVLFDGYGIKTGNLAGSISLNKVYYNLSFLNGNDPVDKMGREFYHHNGYISFINNSTYTTGESSAYGITIAGTGKVVLKNNIFYSFGGQNARCIRRLNSSVLESDNNLYFSTTSTPFFTGSTAVDSTGWKKLKYDANCVNANPLFTTNGSNFTLQPGSPAINRGLNVGLSRDITGNPISGSPDIGAFEHFNDNPRAVAGINRTIVLPVSEVEIEGRGIDTDGSISSYRWSQLAGPQLASISDSSKAKTKFSRLVKGTYLFQLVVIDNEGASGKDAVTVVVNDASVPFGTNAGPDQIIALPLDSVFLKGTSSISDSQFVRYFWSVVEGAEGSTLTNVDSSIAILRNLVQGHYRVRLTAFDKTNRQAVDDVLITVKSEDKKQNQHPIANAGTHQSVALPFDFVMLSGTDSYDPDGIIIEYNWEQISGPTASTFSSSAAKVVSVSGLKQGMYLYKLTVTDNHHNSNSDTVSVSITDVLVDNNRLTLFPNPATNVVNVALPLNNSGTVLFNIYDLFGRKVGPTVNIEKPTGAYYAAINISQLKSGLYTLESSMLNYIKTSSNFIKQ